jgi:hypothetical protein
MGVLIYVACTESANAEWAVEILRRTGAKEPGLLEPGLSEAGLPEAGLLKQEAFMAAAV